MERFLNNLPAKKLMDRKDQAYTGKAELERFLDLMAIPDHQLKIMNSNQRLGYVNDSRILNRTMTEDQYKKSWLYLDNLASEYHDLAKQGIAENKTTKYNRQLEIEAEMVQRMTPYVQKIVTIMVKGSGWEIRTPSGSRILSLKEYTGPLEDLVQEGLIQIVKKIPDYNPEKGRVSTYFSINIAAEMYFRGAEDSGLLRLPEYMFSKAKHIITKNGKRVAIKILETIAKDTPASVPHSLQAIAMYHGLKREWIDIYSKRKSGNQYLNNDTFEGRYLEDKSDNAQIEELVGDKQLQQKAVALLEILTPIERNVIQKRIFEDKPLQEIGQEYMLSRERIRQLESQALQKLQKRVKALL